MPLLDLAPSVGGLLELHYSHPLLGPVYSIRLALTALDPTPSGPDGDYLYTGAGGFTPGESGVLATVAAVAACWAPYYDPEWSLALAAVYQNMAGLPVPLAGTPTAAPVPGTATSGPAPVTVCKRSIWLISSGGQRWRVWLRQLAVAGVGETIDVSTFSGGIDARDQTWFAYVSGSQAAVVGRDGQRFQAGGKVRAWWDTPPAPYLVSG